MNPDRVICESEGAGILLLDGVAAAYVERIGTNGQTYALKIREGGQKRWYSFKAHDQNDQEEQQQLAHIWLPDGDGLVPLFQGIAKCLWADLVKEMAERLHKTPPAFSAAVHDDLASLCSRTSSFSADSGVLLDARGNPLCGLKARPEDTVASIDPSVLEMTVKNIGALSSVTAHRLIRFLASKGHEQWLLGQHDFRSICIDGGWAGLAKAIGCEDSHAAQEKIKGIVGCLGHLLFKWVDGSYGNVLAYRYTPSAKARKARLTLTLGDQLLPLYVKCLDKRTYRQREARLLVPIVPLPPFVGREMDWGPQATLQLLTLRELQSNPRELIEARGVHIGGRKWADLGEQASVPRKILQSVIEVWLKGNKGTPAFLSSPSPEVFALSKAHAAIWDFLCDGARRRCQNRIAGRLSAEHRRVKTMKRSAK